MDLDEIPVFITRDMPGELQYEFEHRGQKALFPKSQVSFKRRNVKTGAALAEIPVWLLKDRGWAGVKPVSPVDGLVDITPQDIAETQPPRIGWDL